jgi:uncharacterized membrane protein
MSTNQTDVIGEYLREVELRLSGLPLLQRRELLADLQAHIDTARAEGGAQSEGELIEVLERLGSPEVVAAAAYEEAGPLRGSPPPQPDRPTWVRWVIAGVVAFGVLFVVGLLFLMFFAGSSTSEVSTVPGSPGTPTVQST